MSDIQPEPEILVSDRYHSPNDSIDETLPTLFDQMPSLHQQPQQQHQELQTQPADNTEQAGNENDNDDEGCHLLTAAGLTRAMETNQGQPLTEIINISTANPSHLFWVPASQHPELAPAEFEKYVTALRTTAIDKGKVRRRRSVLSVSFTAGEDGEISMTTTNDSEELNTSDDGDDDGEGGRQSALDALENRQPQPHSSHLVRSNSMQSLGDMDMTNKDHDNHQTQNQDQHNKLAIKARKDKLRRSMSLQLPGNGTDPGRIPDFLVFDRNSTTLDQSPVLVPRTNRPLSRRGARTKFQRTSSISPSCMKLDSYSPPEKRWPAYRHSDSIYTSSSVAAPTPATSSVNDSDQTNPYNDNNSTGLDSSGQGHEIEPPYQHHNLSDSALLFGEPEIDLDLSLPSSKPIQPVTMVSQQMNGNISISPGPALDLPAKDDVYSALPPHPLITPIDSTASSLPLDRSEVSQPIPNVKSSPRERKSSWSWSFWSDDKKAKSEQQSISSPILTTDLETHHETNDSSNSKLDSSPPQPTTTSSTPTSKQRFGFSSLFSRKTSTSTTSSSSDTSKKPPTTANDECPVNNVPLMPPKDFQLNKINHQRRLPIHVERAVYRLSHVKLANPRRPLHEQVIISNFMFWYLTIISQHQKEASSTSVTSQQDPGNNAPPRHVPPRTPQQIVAASKKKKKRQTKKTSQPSPNGIHKPSMRPSQTLSISSASPNQRNQSLSAAAASSSHMQDKSSWQHIDGSSKQSSTGFVIPENYLRPSSESNLSDSGTYSDHTKRHPRQQSQYARRNSSSSEDDDDDSDDDDSDDDDDDDDDDEVYSKQTNKSQRRTKSNHAFGQQHRNQPQQQQQQYPPTLSSRHSPVPMAAYKKTAIS